MADTDSYLDVRLDPRHEPTMMLIETGARNDVLLVLGFFVFAVAAISLAGIFGARRVQQEMIPLVLPSNVSKASISVKIPGVFPQTLFLSLDFQFQLPNPAPILTTSHISLSYLILFYKGNIEIQREQGEIAQYFDFAKGQTKSREVNFFFDRFVSADQLDLRIDSTEVRSIADIVIIWTTGEVRHIQFQAWIRGIFGVILLGALLLFSRKMAVGSRAATLEQKITLILSISAVIGVNPLFFFFVIEPSLVHDIVTEIVYRIFTSWVFVFVLIVINEVNSDRGSQSIRFSHVIVFLVLIVVETANPLLRQGSELLQLRETNRMVDLVDQIKIVLSVILIVWFIYLCVTRGSQIDVTERFKFLVYVPVFTVVILICACEKILNQCKSLADTSGLFGLRLGTLTAFVLVMIFVHWPYELAKDEVYSVPGDVKENPVQDLFDGQEVNA
jgi:hypothetical protein